MSPPDRLSAGPAPRPGPLGGAAQATLQAVAVRTAASLRAVGALAVVAQTMIWRGFYAGAPAGLAWPAAAVVWTAAIMAWLRWGRPGGRLAAADVTITAAMALGGVGSVPPALRGDTSSWLFLIVVCQIPTSVWLAPRRIAVPLALAVVAAWSAGSWAGVPLPLRDDSAPADVLLLAVVGVSWVGLRTLRRRSAAVDSALATADRQAREQHIERSRNAERREHERLMHDTVLNTLTALARAGGAGSAQVAARCRHDLALMESVLSGRGGPPGPVPGGLTARIGAVAQELRERGLEVHLTAAGSGPGRDGERATAGPYLPWPVIAALADAAREALANVASHAGTGVAWVDLRSGPLAAGPQAPQAAVRVTVRDEGEGFDPAAVAAARLGLRRSIAGRVADCGGASSIASAPGAGTVVTLWWPAGPAGGRAGGAGSRW